MSSTPSLSSSSPPTLSYPTETQAKQAWYDKQWTLAAKFYGDAANEANLQRDKSNESRFLNNRARALMKAELLDEAFDAAKKASQLSPAASKPAFSLAQIYLRKNNHQQAKEYATLSLSLARSENSIDNIKAIEEFLKKLIEAMQKSSSTTTTTTTTAAGSSSSSSSRPNGAATIPSTTSPLGESLILKDKKYEQDPLWQAYDISRLNTQSAQRGLEVHDRYYLVPDDWWQQWADYTGYSNEMDKVLRRILRTENSLPDPTHPIVREAFGKENLSLPGTASATVNPSTANLKTKPGPIPTRTLLARNTEENPSALATSSSSASPSTVIVDDTLRAEEDYQFVPEEAFRALQSWYGIDGPVIERFVVLDGVRTTIDVFPEKNRYSAVNMEVENETNDSKTVVGNTCAQCGKPSNSYCGNCREVFYCSVECQKEHYQSSHKVECRRITAMIDPTKVKLNGKVGLSNLGNTCFMNSSLQALSSVWPITELFLSGRWKADLNVTNILGTKGKLASAYAELMDEMWRGNTSYAVAPARVKQAVSGFQERFSGFAQHDAQELLGYVLDGLHEDLNRVKVRQYVEDEESNGRPDPIVADASWAKYKKRNDSAIVDAFGGQFKNRLECPECKRISVKFDPFNMVPLPVSGQVSNKRYVVVYLQRLLYDPENPLTWRIPTKNDPEAIQYWSRPRSTVADYNAVGRLERFIFAMDHGFTIGDLRKELSKAANIPPLNMEFEKVNIHSKEMNDIFADLNTLPLDQFPDAQRGSRTTFDLVVSETAAPTWRQPGTVDVEKDISHLDPATDYDTWKAELPLSNRILFLVDVRGFDSTYAYGRGDMLQADCTYNKAHESTKSLGPLLISATRATTVAQFRMIVARSLYPLMGPNIKATMIKEKALKAGVKENEVEPPNDAEVHLYIASNIMLASNPSIIDHKYIKFLPGMNEDGTDSDSENPASTTNFNDLNSFPIVELIEWKRHHYDFVWSKVVVFVRGARLTPFVDHKAISSYRNTPSAIKEEEGFIRRSKIEIKDCFEKFRLPEVLDEENLWYCSPCKKHVRATKTMEIWRAPQNLIVHLKRFQQRGRFFEKAEDLVNFPLQGLDLTDYHLSEQQDAQRNGRTPEKCIYDCLAVVNHSGNTWGGHYYAYANHDMAMYGPAQGPGRWYRFDDSYVAPMDEKDPAREVVTRGAYLLVYRRRPNNIVIPENSNTDSSSRTSSSSSSLYGVE